MIVSALTARLFRNKIKKAGSGLKIEKNVWVRGGEGIEFGDDVWICANSVITRNVTIGEHSIIGAGPVVTRDVAPYSVVGGVPAKLIKTRN